MIEQFTETWAMESSRDSFLVPGLMTLWVYFLTYIKDMLFISQD